MTKTKFLIDEALQFGWHIMKKHFFFFAGILLFIFAIQLLPTIIDWVFDTSSIDSLAFFASYLVFYLLLIVFGIIIGMGLVKISLNFFDKKNNNFSILFSQYRLFFPYLLASILYFIIVMLGFILLIIPGVYLSIRFMFFEYLIIDKKMGVIQSLKESWKITKGNFWGLFAFFFVVIVINLLGVFTLLLGLFATIPVTMIAWAFIYRRLLENKQEEIETKESDELSVKV